MMIFNKVVYAAIDALIKKYLSARSPSLLGMTVYRDEMSIVKISLSSLRKLKSRKISSAC